MGSGGSRDDAASLPDGYDSYQEMVDAAADGGALPNGPDAHLTSLAVEDVRATGTLSPQKRNPSQQRRRCQVSSPSRTMSAKSA